MIEFFVPGQPRPGGSKTTGARKDGTRFCRPANPRTKPWMEVVSIVARQHYRGAALASPLRVTMVFYRIRPKSHYRTGKNRLLLRVDAPAHPATKPDLTKTVRSTEDALEGIIFRNDSQVVEQSNCKKFGPQAGVLIRITQLGD